MRRTAEGANGTMELRRFVDAASPAGARFAAASNGMQIADALDACNTSQRVRPMTLLKGENDH